MNKSVDLTNLREITGGETAIERELFQEFIQSGVQCIAALKTMFAPGQEAEWRKQAHAIKGSSLNLGAARLGELCKEAQDSFQSTPEKEALCIAIENEFGQVKEFLERTMQG